jgi:hypothetical protein
MNLEGTRRVMETTSHDTANQYLRFGWNLINQFVTEATENRPASVTYVLASVRRLEDTRELAVLNNPEEVNAYLKLGWKLIDKHVTTSEAAKKRHETIHFVVAWQSEEPPARPGSVSPVTRELRASFSPGDEL